jgi:hypothetical protein
MRSGHKEVNKDSLANNLSVNLRWWFNFYEMKASVAVVDTAVPQRLIGERHADYP